MWILDVECYSNYFLAMFYRPVTGSVVFYERYNDVESHTFSLPDDLIVTFNGYNYDLPMVSAALDGWTNEELKVLSDQIIVDGLKPWNCPIPIPTVNHIDIMQVLPGMSGLKIYGGRIGYRDLRDLPIAPSSTIMPEQVAQLREYCEIDCRVTGALYERIKPQIELRETMGSEYNLHLRSKSDAQIAEAVIKSEYRRLSGDHIPSPPDIYIGKSIRIELPRYVRSAIADGAVQRVIDNVRDTLFEISNSGKPMLPKELVPGSKSNTLNLYRKQYKLGIGGLHSVDRPGSFYATEDVELWDIDVTSYYPNIILTAGLAPVQMGNLFLRIYSKLVADRIEAKGAGNKVKADSLKIVINGSFGKLGSVYSDLYSPDLMLTVTLTGQLCLLMLIEQLGDTVISANTDGITVRIDRSQHQQLKQIVNNWEQQTGLNMEWTPYRSVHRRDVNNYLAITTDGKLKTKGIFADAGLNKNPVNLVCIDAVKAFFLDGTPVDVTIRECQDPFRFTTIRTVKGGAQKDGKIIGKSVRWYYSTESMSAIHYVTNGNTVPRSEGSKLMMTIPDRLPDDIDYQWYIDEAHDILDKIEMRR